MSTPALKLPPRSDTHQESDGERQFRTAVSGSHFLQLEKESMERGLRPYTFVKILVTLYLQGEVVIINELPESAQIKMREFLTQLKQQKQL